MFGKIKAIAAQVQKLDQDKILTEILNEQTLQSKIIERNQEQLYEEGLQADGIPTGSYSFNTIMGTSRYAGKIEKGQRYDHITLKDTGTFYKSMKVKSITQGIVITADDPNDLQAREPKMLGLTPESLSEIIIDVKIDLLNKVKQALRL